MLLFVMLAARVSVAQSDHLLIGGQLVTPDGVAAHGWMELQGGKIVRLYAAKPVLPGVVVLETQDLIFPGFVDLHNHPLYNIFPRWTPPRKYPNRYAWRDGAESKAALQDPLARLQKDGDNFCDIDEYAEVRALIGGTTSMIGITGFHSLPAPKTPDCVKGLVRNLDAYTGFYGSAVDHERIVNSIGILPRDMTPEAAADVARRIQDGAVDLLAIHLAEGLPTDAESAQELDKLDAAHLLTAHTVLIHAVGLSPEQMLRVHGANASIVWSPRSNFELYGATANVDAAFRSGVSIALAPDWSPSGSDNMLDEIRYARHVSETKMNGLFSNRQLVEMASSVPARIARIDDKVGTIAVGEYGDLFLLKPNPKMSNAYDALVQAKVTDVEMVFVDGVPLYGTPERFKELGVPAETISVCGQRRVLNSSALPAGSFAAVTQRLAVKVKAAGSELAPLAECLP
jgi:cytosine/adenosine deaminase-related metal-dependent hydrolase